MLQKQQLMVVSLVIAVLAACSSDQEKIGSSAKEFASIVIGLVEVEARSVQEITEMTETRKQAIVEKAKEGHLKMEKLKASGFQQQSMDNLFHFFRSSKSRELLKDQAPISIGKISIENEIAHAALHLGNKKCDFTFVKENGERKISLISCDRPY